MKYISILLFTLGFLIYSCTPEKRFETQLDEIQLYQNKLDSLEGVFKTIRFDSLEIIVNKVIENLALLKKISVSDTIDREFARAVSEYKSIKKGMGKPMMDKYSLENELGELKIQFSTLKQDIENGLLSEEEVEKYTQTEIENCLQLLEQFGVFSKTYEIVMTIFNTYHPVIEERISTFQNQASQ